MRDVHRKSPALPQAHDREYFPYSLSGKKAINFRSFEHTLLIALDIHRRNPGTSILEKFVDELLDRDRRLKVELSRSQSRRRQEIRKMVELLFFARRESPKLLCHVLALCEHLYQDYSMHYPELKAFLREKIRYEIPAASEESSTFEVVWFIFFLRLLGLGSSAVGEIVCSDEIKGNSFYKSALMSRQMIFRDSGIDLFAKARDCAGVSLAKQVAAFR